uniref:MEAB protein n=1 Tax=Epichloe sp. LpTG-2 TaxID=1648835 RepID=A0A0F7J3Z8_9HYPO|nr:MEAB protein [Epichloe sp. LpTG-2]
MSIDNKPNPPHRDESDDSVDSPLEGDHNASAPASGHSNNPIQDAQQPKRKGGRKPIYATSEERKQRNRQAQAAFRERRTEYIKQLEETIRVHESNLHNLQSAHRNAADECLMLRYKNSLLERILLEKGIDVQAELQAKADSPNLGSAHVPRNIVQPPTIQRPIMNRQHHNRKSNSSIAPKLEPVGSGSQAPKSATSPKSRPTPSSHSNSPTNAGSKFSPAPTDSISMRGCISGLGRQQMSLSGAIQAPRSSVLQTATPRSSVAGAGASFYPTPSFQNHVDPLDHEYDNQADMVDDSELETRSGSGGFNVAFNSDTTQPMLLSPTSTGPPHHEHGGHHASVSGQHFPPTTTLLDHQDWDPFGLSASMAFPNQQFSFDQTSMR